MDNLSSVENKNFYSSIGEFIVTFESLMSAMRYFITTIFHVDGLKNQRLMHIVLSKMMADEINKKFHNIGIEFAGNDKQLIKIIDEIYRKIKVIIIKRNNFIHSSWIIEHGEMDFFKANKKVPRDKYGIRTNFTFAFEGIKFESEIKTVDDLELEIKRNRHYTDIISRLTSFIAYGDDIHRKIKLSEIEFHES